MSRSLLFRLVLATGIVALLLARPIFAAPTNADAKPAAPHKTSTPAAPAAPTSSHKSSTAAAEAAAATAAANAASLAKLVDANQELLDLLKKQQAVLEDIQYDRRLQNRQISSLEERLADATQQNAQLLTKVATLEAQVAVTPARPAAPATPAPATPAPPPPPPKPVAPVSYLPPAETPGAPGTKSWHRLFTLSGTDAKNSEPFHIEGRQWRVRWHNEDRPGTAYANTSALFINALLKGDTVPQKVCSKLGSGGDDAELDGPGDFSLKVEASGGFWELAVEDFK